MIFTGWGLVYAPYSDGGVANNAIARKASHDQINCEDQINCAGGVELFGVQHAKKIGHHSEQLVCDGSHCASVKAYTGTMFLIPPLRQSGELYYIMLCYVMLCNELVISV